MRRRSLLFFQWIVAQKLFNQIDVGQDHAAAAVPLETQLVQSVTLRQILVLQVGQIRLPLVAHNFAAGKAPNGNDHLKVCVLTKGKKKVGYVRLSDHRTRQVEGAGQAKERLSGLVGTARQSIQ